MKLFNAVTRDIEKLFKLFECVYHLEFPLKELIVISGEEGCVLDCKNLLEFLYGKFLTINQVVNRIWSIITEDRVILLGPIGIICNNFHLGNPCSASSTLAMRVLSQVFLIGIFLLVIFFLGIFLIGIFLLEFIQDLEFLLIWGLPFIVTLNNVLLLFLLGLYLHSLVGYQIHVLNLDLFSRGCARL